MKQVARTRLPFAFNYGVGTATPNPCYSTGVPVWLHHEEDPNTKIMAYTLSDDQSDACLVKQAMIEKLSVSGRETLLKLSVILAEETITSQRIRFVA